MSDGRLNELDRQAPHRLRLAISVALSVLLLAIFFASVQALASGSGCYRAPGGGMYNTNYGHPDRVWIGEGGGDYRGFYGGIGRDCKWPTANFQVAPGTNAYAGEPTYLVSTSTIATGTIVSTQWWLDRTPGVDATGTTVSHVYPAGTHSVWMKVTDAQGEYDWAMKKITVVPRPPYVPPPPPPPDPCAGKTKLKLAQCRSLEKGMAQCAKLKGKAAKTCRKRAKARARCELKKGRARAKCIAKTRSIGKRK